MTLKEQDKELNYGGKPMTNYNERLDHFEQNLLKDMEEV